MLDWIEEHRALLVWMAIGSAVIFVASLVLVPAVVARIPADYFAHDSRPKGGAERRHRLIRAARHVGKNVLGVLFVLAGIAMLALPGQGLLTIVVGVFLIDFPGKYKLEKRVVAKPGVLRAINWLRKRAGREPLITENPAKS